ncbi:hypothetical protein TNCV_1782351 [Trichonephila clavipes]|nr:hypothetical protein TNCV_1782351 [Trichonephila clavipes]
MSIVRRFFFPMCVCSEVPLALTSFLWMAMHGLIGPVEELLESEDIARMDWPAYSPDLNPIEHVIDAFVILYVHNIPLHF